MPQESLKVIKINKSKVKHYIIKNQKNSKSILIEILYLF